MRWIHRHVWTRKTLSTPETDPLMQCIPGPTYATYRHWLRCDCGATKPDRNWQPGACVTGEYSCFPPGDTRQWPWEAR